MEDQVRANISALKDLQDLSRADRLPSIDEDDANEEEEEEDDDGGNDEDRSKPPGGAIEKIFNQKIQSQRKKFTDEKSFQENKRYKNFLMRIWVRMTTRDEMDQPI